MLLVFQIAFGVFLGAGLIALGATCWIKIYEYRQHQEYRRRMGFR